MVQKCLTEEDGKYDRILGESAVQEALNGIGMKFSMSGSPIPGRKVDLLDKYHLWCYFLDPFNHLWRSTLKVEGSLWVHAGGIIAHVSPFYAPQALLRCEVLLEEFELRIFI